MVEVENLRRSADPSVIEERLDGNEKFSGLETADFNVQLYCRARFAYPVDSEASIVRLSQLETNAGAFTLIAGVVAIIGAASDTGPLKNLLLVLHDRIIKSLTTTLLLVADTVLGSKFMPCPS